MKISVSLPDEDVRFLDQYGGDHDGMGRSAVLHVAVDKLRAQFLSDAYEDAWNDWNITGEAALWEPATGDGLTA